MKKYILLLLAIIALSSCTSKNELMTKLINEKKAIEDSIDYARYNENDFMKRAKEELHSSHDTTKAYPLGDSSVKYAVAGSKYKRKLKEIEFSIDSLSKMK